MENNEHKPKVWMAADPGKSGALAFVNEINSLVHFPIPIVGDEISITDLHKALTTVNERFHVIMCVIEDVHSIFGTSAKSNFEFGRSLGLLEGVIIGIGIPMVKVAPKAWQKQMLQGIPKMDNKKSMSLLAAQRLMPNNSFLTNDSAFFKTERARKPHDGVVDAALMSLYCKLNYSL